MGQSGVYALMMTLTMSFLTLPRTALKPRVAYIMKT